MNSLNKHLNYLNPSITISLFRLCFSIVLLIQSVHFISGEFINENIIKPLILFPFSNMITPASETTLIALGYLLLISNIGMLFNKTARFCTIVFFFCFTYFWLLDKGYFNNHYYFISLICFLIILVEKKSSFKKNILTPNISIIALQLMVFIIYFVSGLNKLNPYWLFDLQPIKHILEAKYTVTDVNLFINPIVIFLMTYFGLIFDLFIGFLLFIKKTRVFAFVIVILFNIINFYIFRDIGEIGVFPFIMISTIILFFDPVKTKKLLIPKSKKQTENIKHSSLLTKLLIVFIFLQCLLPFRHYLFSGYVDYNGVGQRFSWRMKLMYKEVNLQYYITDLRTNQRFETNVANMLTNKQFNNLKYFPDLVVPLAKKIKEISRKEKGIMYPKITCDYNIQFMNHSTQKLFNPNIDLSAISNKKLTNTWIKPLKK